MYDEMVHSWHYNTKNVENISGVVLLIVPFNVFRYSMRRVINWKDITAFNERRPGCMTILWHILNSTIIMNILLSVLHVSWACVGATLNKSHGLQLLFSTFSRSCCWRWQCWFTLNTDWGSHSSLPLLYTSWKPCTECWILYRWIF